MCSQRGRAGQVVGAGFSGKRSQLGVRTTAAVKKLGCSNLKTLLEDDKILVIDYEIISELTTFSQKHNSFEAEEGCNDDLAMCLVLFAWLVAQDYFKEMTDNDVRKRLYEEQKNQIEQDMAPFGFVADGLDEGSFVDKDGDLWHTDEYGDQFLYVGLYVMELTARNVINSLSEIAPYIEADGGFVEFVEIEEETKFVKVRLGGACTSCAMSAMTLKQGIQKQDISRYS